ncbi:hypothetical protein Tco_0793653 [Tanacetum coccineum]
MKEEFVHTPSLTNDKDDDNLESKSDEESDDVIKGDKEIDDTTNQFDDDVDARLKEPTQTNKEVVQGEGVDAEMNDAQQGNENLETTQEQVINDAHVKISNVTKKTEVPVTSSSHSSDLASKFLIFLDIPHADAEIVSLLDVHVYHEVARTHAPTLLTVSVSVITESSSVYTNIPQSLQIFTPPPPLATPTPPPTIATTNPLSILLDFASVFRFDDRITTLEKEVAELQKDPIHTQVTTLVDEHVDTRLGETKEEFMKFLSESLTAIIKEQVIDQPPQILLKEVSNLALLVIETLIKESHDEVTLAKVSSQPHSTYEDASTLIEFELKKILIDKMEKSKSYLVAPEQRDFYDILKKYYNLDKDFFFSYDVYSLKRGRKDKDKDEDPSTGSDRGLKKRKTSKDAEPTTGLKNKDSTSSSSKGTKSQPKPSGKSVQSEEPVFEVADSNMPQDQEGNPGDNDDEPKKEDASRCDWFKKPIPPQEPTDPDWHEGKTLQKGPTQKYLEEIVVRRADNNQLINLLGDDVADFAIALRMFTRSLVIQKKRHPYTPYKDPQGFIYVDDYKRNRLMGSDELYKFSDDTLTRLLSSLEDITKNIDMKYLPKRRWSTLEKKRAHFMIKDINKLLKERRMIRSLEKFVGEHAEFDESDTYVLERFDTSAGNPVKEILLKLNLPDHRIFKDGGEVKEIQERCIIKAFQDYQIKKGMSMSVQKSMRWQNLQDGETRLCLANDLKVFKITFSHSSQDKATSSHLKSMITTSNHKLMIEVKDYELKTEVKE